MFLSGEDFFYQVVGIWQGIILTIWTSSKAKAKAFEKVWMVKIMACQIPII